MFNQRGLTSEAYRRLDEYSRERVRNRTPRPGIPFNFTPALGYGGYAFTHGQFVNKIEPVQSTQMLKYAENLGTDFYEDVEMLKAVGVVIDVDNPLGSGNFGIVYRGVYSGLQTMNDTEGNQLYGVIEGRPFAAKVVDFSAEPKDADQSGYDSPDLYKNDIRREKEVMSKCAFRYLVRAHTIFNMGPLEDVPYEPPKYAEDGSPLTFRSPQRVIIIMDFADFGPLEHYIANNGGLEVIELLRFSRHMLEGLRYLHKKRIVHRDLHMGNVLLFSGSDGRPVAKLSDFGLSQLLSPNFDFLMKEDRRKLSKLFNEMLNRLRNISDFDQKDITTYKKLIDELAVKKKNLDYFCRNEEFMQLLNEE